MPEFLFEWKYSCQIPLRLITNTLIILLKCFFFHQFELYQHEIQVLAGNRLLYSYPFTLLITLMDENDNLPVFTQELYQIALQENTAKCENGSYAVTQTVKL